MTTRGIPGSGPALLARYRFTQACTGCGACLLTCPQRAIRPGSTEPLYVLPERCDGCRECIEVCPADAIIEVW